jgi:S-methylmethionine-dependent homocysteine/selenocysteine methylase
MSKFRTSLPQLNGRPFLSDSGLETTLVFLEGIDLPCFAAFPLLDTPQGQAALDRYVERHLAIALRDGWGFILDTPTWRANADWGARMGYSPADLDRINRKAVAAALAVRARAETAATPIVVNGVFGPRGDGYRPESLMTAKEAFAYHLPQMTSFAEAGADMATAATMTHVGEGAGIALAGKAAGLPVVISFTVETDGRLPTGQTLAEAILETDEATGSAPAYYMVNCAHPDHFRDGLDSGAEWMRRLRGIRANASRQSHAELDAATELDDGDPIELGADYLAIIARHPQISVLGGCCGTDHRHIDEISKGLSGISRPAA